MTMDTRLKCEKPEEIRYTLTVTMTAGEWDRLRDQLDSAKHPWISPARDLVEKINDLLAQARKIYYPSPEQEP